MNKIFADDSHVRVLGRTLFMNNIRYLSWSCSGVEFLFTGSKLTAEIWTDWVRDEPWKDMFQCYAAVFIDGEEIPRKRFAIEAGTNSYTIYESDVPSTVKIKILKLSEAAFSKTGIVSFSADGEITPAKPLSRRFEFIGDSITCGFGIEAKCTEEGFRTETENSYITYGAETAKAFNADFNLISWSTIGVYSSDCKEDAEKPNDGWVMPMLYDYTDIGLEGTLGISEHTEWDFGGFVPDVIVINLGTNDKSFTKGIPERIESFKSAYKKFILHVREKNPTSEIICTLGMMGTDLCPAIEEAVTETGDKKIHALMLDEQLPEDGIGSGDHPNWVTHKKAAEKLIQKIKETSCCKL